MAAGGFLKVNRTVLAGQAARQASSRPKAMTGIAPAEDKEGER